jgi:hypothetical protein
MIHKFTRVLAILGAISILQTTAPAVAAANSPVPKSFADKSGDDIAVVCSRRLKNAAVFATGKKLVNEKDLVAALLVLQQSMAWTFTISNFNSDRATNLYRWMLAQPDDEHSRQLHWCSETAEAIYKSVSLEARQRIDGVAAQELRRLVQ